MEQCLSASAQRRRLTLMLQPPRLHVQPFVEKRSRLYGAAETAAPQHCMVGAATVDAHLLDIRPLGADNPRQATDARSVSPAPFFPGELSWPPPQQPSAERPTNRRK